MTKFKVTKLVADKECVNDDLSTEVVKADDGLYYSCVMVLLIHTYMELKEQDFLNIKQKNRQ